MPDKLRGAFFMVGGGLDECDFEVIDTVQDSLGVLVEIQVTLFVVFGLAEGGDGFTAGEGDVIVSGAAGNRQRREEQKGNHFFHIDATFQAHLNEPGARQGGNAGAAAVVVGEP